MHTVLRPILGIRSSAVQSYENVFSSTFNINVSNLNEGIYFVKIKHGNSSSVIRFIQEKNC